ncbi:MAG: NAD(P)/FAD-dependent oxidoreductase [Thermodesulfobacteriota bacterium]
MAEKHFIVIGNGPAGKEAAFTLQERNPESRITVINKGRASSYSPHLLPDLIAGQIQEDELYGCALSSYAEKDIKLRCCQEVVDLNLSENKIALAHKEVLSFDGLIIAVGGIPRIPENLLAYKDLMYTLKTQEDAKIWIEKLQQSESVLIIGGDLSSLALTKALIHLKKKVFFILNEDAFWPLRYNEDLFKEATHHLTDKGIEIIHDRNIKKIAQLEDGTYKVQLDEQVLQVGMVGAFFGLVPDIGFLAHSGLRIDRGILVDKYLNAGVENIYAAGDCAQIYHPDIKDYWISVGYDNARMLGRTAALNLSCGCLEEAVKPESIFAVQGININTTWWTEF